MHKFWRLWGKNVFSFFLLFIFGAKIIQTSSNSWFLGKSWLCKSQWQVSRWKWRFLYNHSSQTSWAIPVSSWIVPSIWVEVSAALLNCHIPYLRLCSLLLSDIHSMLMGQGRADSRPLYIYVCLLYVYVCMCAAYADAEKAE